MRFDNDEVHVIKIALTNRIYQLDQIINENMAEGNNKAITCFLNKERKQNIDLIKKIKLIERG